MGESTFEFSVNEYSWQPKVNILVFSFLSNLTPGSKVSAPEELEPYLRMLHGKQSKKDFYVSLNLCCRVEERWGMRSMWTGKRWRMGPSRALVDPFKDFQLVFAVYKPFHSNVFLVFFSKLLYIALTSLLCRWLLGSRPRRGQIQPGRHDPNLGQIWVWENAKFFGGNEPAQLLEAVDPRHSDQGHGFL